MPFPSKVIANEFLELARRDGQDVTPMKLQKLVYLAHGWHLALTGQPLLEERIEAWQFGPVIPALYRDFKRFGSGPVREMASAIALSSAGIARFHYPKLADYAQTDDVVFARKLIERIWQVYGEFSAVKLSNASHQAGTPWAQVYREGQQSIAIPDELIADYFKQFVHDEPAAAAR
ncbi:MAG TPA: type II toxin-antitoxin system antitoxin SocA domain-containing protein [Verrucomicrobiae bacterium]|nr:type II toxin-antitoxin system antitoxin SocA domain-containing protein [Verrucomicrobiae bacterium]